MLPLNNNNQAVGAPAINVVAPSAAPKGASPYAKVIDMLTVFATKWYWFVICLALGLGGAYVYLQITPPIYTRSASILIKNDFQTGSGSGGGMSMNVFGGSVDVQNELFTLRSSDIAETTVRNLHLEVNYYAQGRFHEEAIYGTALPVQIIPLDINDQESAGFMFDLKSDGTYTMDHFVRGEKKLSGSIMGKVGRTVKTPIGKVEVNKTVNYTPQELSLRIDRTAIQTAVNKITDGLNVSAVSEMSTIIQLTYDDESPQRAEDVLSTLIAVYNENWVKDCNRRSVSTSEFIGERLEVIEKELGNVENDISTFKSENLIPAGQSDVASIYIGQATSASAQSTEISNQLHMARYVRNYLTNDANKYTLIPANQGVNSPNISGQIAEYNTLLLTRNNLLSASSLANPIIQEKDLQLAELRNAVIASVDNHIASLNVELSSAQAIRGQANSKIASSPSQSKYLLNVERQQKVKESLYLYLLQKREENELSQAFTAYNNRVINSATGSNIPTFPVPSMVWMIGAILGIVVPGLLIFLSESMNNKVRGRKDLNEISIPFIGEIPIHRHHRTLREKLVGPWKNLRDKLKILLRLGEVEEDKTLHILVKDHSRNVINEAFRVIRTNIEFMMAKGARGKVIMLTSFNPNSGKTFVVTNLITSFAIKKQRVLAIDLDLRKASLSMMVDKPKIGISDYLSGVTDSFDDIVVRDATHEYLDIVPVGTVPPNPTELLFDDRLGKLLDELRNQYSYIILDCPPIEIVADATIVGRCADATLFIIRAEVLDRSFLPDLQKYYEDNRLPKMSIILNGTTDSFSYYGYHRYGSRYGYYGGSAYGGYAKDDD